VLFAATELADEEDSYEDRCRAMLARRLELLYAALDIDLGPDEHRAGYYVELDMVWWARRRYGPEMAERLAVEADSVGLVCDLAANAGLIVLDGGGFAGPDLSIRISLANLRDDDYTELGARIVERFDHYRQAWFGDRSSDEQAGETPGRPGGSADYGSANRADDEEST
jgi:aspartate 4-decarboxylase